MKTRTGLFTSIFDFYFKIIGDPLLATLQSLAAEIEHEVEHAFSASAHPVQIFESVVDVMLDSHLFAPVCAHTGQHKYQEL